ncbi:major royal jelly protein 3-like [Temnothorax longispinosus]|uniref:major royal jelly protein 3-like n=1 Tax=Temnothorax longispinosus TaxID=300112 RepID=UPI003A9A2ED2
MKYSLFALLILVMAIMSRENVEVKYIYEWKYAAYAWQSQEQMEVAVASGNYNPKKCLLYDASKADDGRVFITIPREMGPGSPATLATVTDVMGTGGPLLSPYPNWSWHTSRCMCDGIVNVHRTHIRCNHLFVLDNGKIGLDQICDPKLLIFNLEDDTLIKTIHIPIELATNQTGFGLLVTPLVYVPGNCSRFLDEMIVFIADMQGSGLVVYDASTKRMCRVESDYMKPTSTFVSVANENFTYVGGIFSMTIIYDDLYYAAVSGKEIYKIKMKTLLECPNKEQANKQSKVVIKLSSLSGQIASTGHAILYSDSLTMSILGTNVCTKSNKNTVVLAQDFEKLQTVCSLKVSYFFNEVTGLSNRFQRQVLGTMDIYEINFRYFTMNLSEVQNEIFRSAKGDMISPTTTNDNFWISWLLNVLNEYFHIYV